MKTPLSMYSILAKYANLDLPSESIAADLLLPPEPDTLLARESLHDSLFSYQNRDLPNLVISGVPGGGKTRLALAMALCRALQRPEKTVFYAAPTRPLAQETFSNFQHLCKGLIKADEVVLSTGDVTGDDWKIYKGAARICVTIFEKLLAMLLADWKLGKKASIFIVDEAHMFNEPERGVKLDMLLAALACSLPKDTNNAIEIALLTVENGKSLGTLAARLEKQGITGSLPCRFIHANRRAIPHRHIWLAHGHAPGHEKPLLYGITYNFGKKDDLYLTENALHKIPAEVEKLARFSSKCDRAFVLDDEIVRYLATQYKRLMVIGLNISMLEKMAHRLMLAREHTSQEQVFLDGLKRLLQDGVISQNHARHLENLARAGVFLHTGTMHSDLRKLVEDRFQKGAQSGLLLATTTMAYGVNLDLDAVAITSLAFTVADGSKRFMDSVVYHNIMGRSGRFSAHGGDCLLLLHACSRDSEDTRQMWEDRKRIITACYARHDLPALQPNPLDATLSATDENRQRMLMFALRMAELEANCPVDGVEALQIATILQNTVHALVYELSEPEIEESIKKGLEEIATFQFGGCRMVERSDNCGQVLWRSTASGRALLECGGVFEDALRMGQMLEYGRKHFGPKLLSSALYPLAALALNPRIRKAIMSIYGPIRNISGASKFNEAMCILGHSISSCCHINDMIAREWTAMLASAWRELADGDSEKLPYELFRTLIVLAATLQWVDGKSLEDIESTLTCAIMEKGHPVRFQARLLEQFSWCCRELAGFFGGSFLLGAAQMANAAGLSRRLQHGLRDEWLPLLGATHNRGSVLGYTSSAHTAEENKARQNRKMEYYFQEAKSYISWLSHIVEPDLTALVEESLMDLLARKTGGARENIRKVLERIFPGYDWLAECAINMHVDWLARGWSYFTAAALMRQNILRPRDFCGSMPVFLQDIFPVFDKKGLSRAIYEELAFINAPNSPQRYKENK